MNTTFDALEAILLLAIFAALLLAAPVLFFRYMRTAGGSWSALRKAYAAGRIPPGAIVRSFRSGRVGFTNYRGMLTIGVAREGLYLDCPLSFGLAKPVLIPWKEIAVERRGWFDTVLRVDRPYRTFVRLGNGHVDRARREGFLPAAA